MLNQKQVNQLIDLGYGLDFEGRYLFKTVGSDGVGFTGTTIFIEISDGSISFEGSDNHREQLLIEAKEVISND